MLKYKKGDTACRAIAIAKTYDDECKTTYLNIGGRRVEHLMCACISGDSWFLHPGGILHHQDMFKGNVQESAKVPRLNGPTKKIESLRPCDLLNKLMAIAHFQAEIERADIEGRDPDMAVADALFQKNPFEWGKKMPKQIFVLWTSKYEGGAWEHHVNEVTLSSLYKFR